MKLACSVLPLLCIYCLYFVSLVKPLSSCHTESYTCEDTLQYVPCHSVESVLSYCEPDLLLKYSCPQLHVTEAETHEQSALTPLLPQ